MTLDLNPSGTVARLSLGSGRGTATYHDRNRRSAVRLAAADDLRGLRIDAPNMPRQRELLALLQHLPALREAGAGIRRVAVLSNSPPSEFLPVLRQWFGCEVRHFSATGTRAADHWLEQAGESATSATAPVAATSAAPTAESALDEDRVGLPAASLAEDDVIVLDDEEAGASADDDIDSWFVKN